MIVAYTPLHYGVDYLRYAVRSVAPLVDKHIILYTPQPSYGHATRLKCPENERQLRASVADFDHVEWHTGTWHNESEHRSAVMEFLPRNTWLLVPIDADELWDSAMLQRCVTEIQGKNPGQRCRRWRVHGFVHYWKSFHYVCTDNMAPVRFIDLRATDDSVADIRGGVRHFGYAQRNKLMEYKWAIHGHKNELRKDYDWLEMYKNWRPGVNDVHPTCVGIWNPREWGKDTWLDLMRVHPFAELQLI
jgi:hypothetical protein